MTDLTELLERTAAQTPVGPPPLDALHTGARRRRHRRTAAFTTLTAAAVAAVIGTSIVLTPHPPATPLAPPTRLVGFGHAAIAVPADWPTNKARCGTPTQDTLLIDDPSAMLYCMSFPVNGVESVQLSGVPTIGFHADETFEINGVRAARQRTTCSTADFPERKVTTCRGAVALPSLRVWFDAASSTSAEEVDRMLAQIRIVPDRTGVPSYDALRVDGRSPTGATYAAALEQAGLKPRFGAVKSPNYRIGTVLGVSPAPGTMLAPGAVVTVTVAR